MKKIIKILDGKSWRTTVLGVAAMGVGVWALRVHWISYQSLYFNLVYAGTGPLALILVGWGLIHARDHRC